MINDKKVLAIIPARGGSKRLPGKNILPLADIPLIGWTINAAINCSSIDKVIVSTDCQEIADVSKSFGADVPFVRPKDLSNDFASSIAVVLHSIDFIVNSGWKPDLIVLLQPTSPLRTSFDIDNAFGLYNDKNADSIVSVCESEHSPIWANVLPENMLMSNFLPKEHLNRRSQDLPTYYRLNGAIYIANVLELIKYKSFIMPDNTYAYIMDKEHSVDIDTYLDFKLAEFILS